MEGSKKMHRNRVIESQIRLFTDDWDLRTIAMSDIDEAASRNAQNRRGEKLDEDHAFRIAEAMDLGVEHPPLIVNQVGDRYWIIDGNHRHAGSQLLGRDHLDAYVVRVDADTYTQMCLSGNAFNGKPLTDADRVANAIAQIERGMSSTTASKLWGIDSKRLQFLNREREGRRKFADAGVQLPKGVRLQQGHAEILNRLEVDHIRHLGAEAVRANKADLETAVRCINAAPSADRGVEARKQSIVLETKRQQKALPKARVMTNGQARRHVKEVLLAVRTNRAMTNDATLVALVTELAEVIRDAGRGAA